MKRKCPICKTKLIYKNKQNFIEACRDNRPCSKCKWKVYKHPMKGTSHSEETKAKLSSFRTGKTWEQLMGYELSKKTKENKRKSMIGKPLYKMTDEIRRKMANSKNGEKCVWYGKKHSIATRMKMSRSHKGENAVWYGKKFTAEHIEKLRISRLKAVRDRYGVYYNPLACDYFNKLEKERGWNGKHATKGGEHEVSGYSVDYYEPTLNIIIEYDEPHHYNLNGTLKSRDRRRQKIIMEKSNCKMFRYNELKKELYECKKSRL